MKVAGTKKWSYRVNGNDLRFYDETNGSDKVTFQSGGNVGIGTTGPNAPLQVQTGTLNAGVIIRNTNTTNGNSTPLFLTDYGNSTLTNINIENYLGKFVVRTGATTEAGFGTSRFVLDTTGNVGLGGSITASTLAGANMVIQSTGNVGIGTTSPGVALNVIKNTYPQFVISDVATDATTKYGMFGTTHYTTAEEPVGVIGATSNSTDNIISIGGGFSQENAATSLRFFTAANQTTVTGTERMRLGLGLSLGNSYVSTDPGAGNMIISGNVGIGTTSPSARLNVVGTNYTSANLAEAFASTALRVQPRIDQTHSLFITTVKSSATLGIQGASNASTATDLALNPYGGNVGIGTTAPEAKLTVGDFGSGSGEATYKGFVQVAGAAARDDTNTTLGLEFRNAYSGSGYGWRIANPDLRDGNTPLMFEYRNDSATWTPSVTFKANGNVGIGTTSPSYKLDVAGDLRITGTPYRTGGDIAWQTPSDSRLKNIVGVADRGIDDLMKLNEVKFNYKADNPFGLIPNQTHIGLIAQDVQKIFPEAVMEDRGYLTLNTTPIFWAMLRGVQQQQTQISGITENQNKIVNQLTGQLADQSLSVDNKLQLIGASLDALTTEQIETLKEQITLQTKDISDLKDQIKLLQDETKAVIDFQIAFNLGKVIIKDNLGNINLLEGKITALDIEALHTITATDIKATNSLEGQKLKLGTQTSGTSAIKAGELESAKILTTEAQAGIKLYITPKGSTQGKTLFYDESDIDSGVGFKVKIDAPALDKDVEFNWLIVK
ncbi:MAG: tail fiber domain-containing protein, partial [Candidatus Moraniibacteriota bacterium]